MANIFSISWTGNTDPYVILTLGDQVIRSKKNSQTTVIGPPGGPIWNQVCVFPTQFNLFIVIWKFPFLEIWICCLLFVYLPSTIPFLAYCLEFLFFFNLYYHPLFWVYVPNMFLRVIICLFPSQDFQLLVVDRKTQRLDVRVRDYFGITAVTVGAGEVMLSLQLFFKAFCDPN